MLRGAVYMKNLTSTFELLAEGWATGRMAEGWQWSHNLGVPILARYLDHLLRFVL
jgi:hypothetical protein